MEQCNSREAWRAWQSCLLCVFVYLCICICVFVFVYFYSCICVFGMYGTERQQQGGLGRPVTILAALCWMKACGTRTRELLMAFTNLWRSAAADAAQDEDETLLNFYQTLPLSSLFCPPDFLKNATVFTVEVMLYIYKLCLFLFDRLNFEYYTVWVGCVEIVCVLATFHTFRFQTV